MIEFSDESIYTNGWFLVEFKRHGITVSALRTPFMGSETDYACELFTYCPICGMITVYANGGEISFKLGG